MLAFLAVKAQDNPRIKTLNMTAKEVAHYMAPGWNLGNTMEAGDKANLFSNKAGVAVETSWQTTRTTRELINFLKKKGFKSIRIPVSWAMGHITNKDEMTIDPAWVKRIQQIVDYCIDANMYVVINDHWDGGWLEYDGFTSGANVEEKKEQFRKLWTNIATAFKNYDERLIFAGMNEPGVGGSSGNPQGSLIFDKYKDDDEKMKAFSDRLIEYEQVFINAVRATGGNNARRILVVQGPSTNFVRTFKYFDIKRLKDTIWGRLMVEVHHYDPYQFCLLDNDADWGRIQYFWPGYAPDKASDRTVSVFVEEEIKTQIYNLKKKFVEKGYPVLVGEYGCNHRSLGLGTVDQAKHDESVAYWYNLNTMYMMGSGLIPFVWDTNNLGNPSLTVIDRKYVEISEPIVYDAIIKGVKTAKQAYEYIYPKPF